MYARACFQPSDAGATCKWKNPQCMPLGVRPPIEPGCAWTVSSIEPLAANTRGTDSLCYAAPGSDQPQCLSPASPPQVGWQYTPV